MKTLILADIHANLPAFEAVLQAAGNWDRLFFLGDVANFGPHPAECVELLRSLDPICVMGNHDAAISDPAYSRILWDEWSRSRLSEDQLSFLQGFPESRLLDRHLLLLHEAKDISYQLVPNTPPCDLKAAFEKNITEEINSIFFGHYHYQIDAEWEGISYHGIRAVGQLRDSDMRTGYSVLENGALTHHRIPYDVEKTVYDTERLLFLSDAFRARCVELLRTGYEEHILRNFIAQMRKNQEVNHGTPSGSEE